jgi:putative DNA primase/helicase
VRLAKRIDADIDELREEFEAFVEEQIAAKRDKPWAEPVDSATMLAETKAQFRRFVVASDEGTVATVLWTAQSWVHNEIATHSPILVLTSIVPASGKTTGLGVLEQMTPNAYNGVELTGPNLFHIVDSLSPTLIIDEADRLFYRRPDLANLINAGWTRGATVPRLVHGMLRNFNIFCPKVIGSLGLNVSPQTATRFIVVKLFPKLPEEKVEAFHFAADENFVTLRRKLQRWAINNASKLKDAKPEMPVGFDNRLGQNWRLLFAIAEDAGGDWPKLARAAAVTMSRKSEDEAPEPVRLLAAVRPLVTGLDFKPSADLHKQLNADVLGEWRDFRGRGQITEKQMAVLLGQFDIHPQVYHPTRDVSVRGYVIDEHFASAFRRYLPDLPATSPTRTRVRVSKPRGGKKRRKK